MFFLFCCICAELCMSGQETYDHPATHDELSIGWGDQLFEMLCWHSSKDLKVSQHWFGGEPLYNKGIISYITKRLKEEEIPFQCQIVGAAGGSWRLKQGQNRTECPKGLLSNKTVPCRSCMGRCVGPNPGKAKYYQRNPDTLTLLNGKQLSEWGNEINAGDIVSFGNVSVSVID